MLVLLLDPSDRWFQKVALCRKQPCCRKQTGPHVVVLWCEPDRTVQPWAAEDRDPKYKPCIRVEYTQKCTLWWRCDDATKCPDCELLIVISEFWEHIVGPSNPGWIGEWVWLWLTNVALLQFLSAIQHIEEHCSTSSRSVYLMYIKHQIVCGLEKYAQDGFVSASHKQQRTNAVGTFES